MSFVTIPLLRTSPLQRRHACTKTRPVARIELELLPIERTALLMVPGPTTLTVFRGRIASARPILERRVGAILAANPWLGSMVDEGRHGSVCAYYSEAPPPTKRHFSVRYDIAQLGPGARLNELVRGLSEVRCPPASYALNKDVAHWRVSLVSLGPGLFGVVVSSAHFLLDARGFYALHDMVLGNPSAVRPLTVKRHQRAVVKTRTREQPPFFWPLLTRALQVYYGDGLQDNVPMCAFELSMQWIRAKRNANSIPTSTNDVLIAELARCHGGRPYNSVGVAVDLRARIAGRALGVRPNDVGNYVDSVTLFPNDFGTPEGVRRAISKYEPGRRPSPTPISRRGGRAAFVSNWTLFSKPFELDSAVPLLHLPVVVNAAWRDVSFFAVVRPGQGRVAIAVHADADIIAAVRASEMVACELRVPHVES